MCHIHSHTTFCGSCFDSSFSQLKTSFGAPVHLSSLSFTEYSKQKACNVGREWMWHGVFVPKKALKSQNKLVIIWGLGHKLTSKQGGWHAEFLFAIYFFAKSCILDDSLWELRGFYIAPSILLSYQYSIEPKECVYILWAGPIQNFGFKIHFGISGFYNKFCGIGTCGILI